MRFQRACGVLLHPTSLPGPYGIGGLGSEARRYLEWLAQAGVTWWQVLPLAPPGPGNSPYAATSSSAGSPLLLSLGELVDDGLLLPEDLHQAPALPDTYVDFESVRSFKEAMLRRAWTRFRDGSATGLMEELPAFRLAQSAWLPDFALFAAIRRAHDDRPWWEWPLELALHDDAALATWRREHGEQVAFEEFCQLLFDRQWKQLRAFAASLGIRILGDLPIYVAEDSADVWANRGLFQLDPSGRPTVVAGVPPDYFSEDGQLWGNPVYAWEANARTGYRWWIERMRRALDLADAVRIDHFRGLAGYWAIPAGAKTAKVGAWLPGPGRALFDALERELGELPLVAEDLGVVTPDVEVLRDELGLPGMAVLQFGFSPAPRSTFVPYLHRANQVVYTGTHDNNTTLGWYFGDAFEGERDFFRRYAVTDAHEPHWDMVRLALASVADLAVIPHQDIAGLGTDCRMNTPSEPEGNWRFRITDWMMSDWHALRLGELVELYGRKPAPEAEAERETSPEPL